MRSQRIVIRFPNWLGDLVMSMGFVDLIKKVFPDSIIDGIAKRSLAPLVDFDSRIGKCWGIENAKPIVEGKNVASDIDEPYNWAFVLPRSFSSALFLRQIPAKRRIGYSNELRSFLLSDRFRFLERGHRVYEYVELGVKFFEKMQMDIDSSALISSISTGFEIDEDYISKMTKDVTLDSEYILLNIVSEASSRTLPEEYARRLVESLLEIDDYRLVFTGLPKQRLMIEKILEPIKPKGRLLNYAGRTGLMELVKLIRGSSLMISVDSGPAHLANSLGRMTFDLSGPDDPEITAPFNANNLKVFRSDVDCAPCVRNKCKKGDNRCLTEIEIPQIIGRVREFLD